MPDTTTDVAALEYAILHGFRKAIPLSRDERDGIKAFAVSREDSHNWHVMYRHPENGFYIIPQAAVRLRSKVCPEVIRAIFRESVCA